jgi:FAD/FMN-containing dehydrogenase
MSKKGDLTKIFGEKAVLDSPEVLTGYSADMSFAQPTQPEFVVKAVKLAQVQELVNWAKRTSTPLVPVSSGPPHFHGDTVPTAAGAVIVDLSGMKKMIDIDRRNRLIVIEPGITYGELQPELARHDMRLTTTLMPRANKSVIASLLEREPVMVPRFQWSVLDPLRCVEVVWGDGQRMVTGGAEAFGSLEEDKKHGMAPFMPAGPIQMDFYRFVTGAQGSMGIVTWASIKCEVLPQIHNFYLAPSQDLNGIIDFVYKLLRFRFGDELMIVNGAALAGMLGQPGLAEKLPAFAAIIGIAGRDRLPKERVAYQEKDIANFARKFDLEMVKEVPGVTNDALKAAVLNPSPSSSWKLGYKSANQDIIFITTLEKTPEFIKSMQSLAEKHGYPVADISVYLQPLHQGASCHCEFNLPYEAGSIDETARIKVLLEDASTEMLARGAFYSRPYGIWADMAYKQDAQSMTVLKTVKSIFDPNNIMNPGKLCF